MDDPGTRIISPEAYSNDIAFSCTSSNYISSNGVQEIELPAISTSDDGEIVLVWTSEHLSVNKNAGDDLRHANGMDAVRPRGHQEYSPGRSCSSRRQRHFLQGGAREHYEHRS